MDTLEIHVDRGDGKGSNYLSNDSHPDSLDTAPLPALGVGAVWTYRAIYRLHNHQVGQWSAELKVSVMGV